MSNKQDEEENYSNLNNEEEDNQMSQGKQSVVKRSNNFVIQNNSIQFENENENIRLSDSQPTGN